jgi:octaprenyl-diphosphate synthase
VRPPGAGTASRVWPDAWVRVTRDVRGHLVATERMLEGETAGLRPILGDGTQPTVLAGGKRVRPLVLLLAAATGRPTWSKAHAAACAVEMVHTASLLHDDVLDDAVVRRDTPTLCAIIGAKRAVLAGDILYSRALEACLREELVHAASLLAAAARQMSEAEAEQTVHDGELSWSVGEYMDIVRRKTGSLFGAAAAAGACLSGKEAREEAFARFGVHLGTAFQIVDDVLDYLPERPGWGKHSLSDLRQHRATLPLLIAYESGGLETWPDPGEAHKVLQECGALEGAVRVAREEAEAACSALRALASGSAHDALVQLTALVVDRTA